MYRIFFYLTRINLGRHNRIHVEYQSINLSAVYDKNISIYSKKSLRFNALTYRSRSTPEERSVLGYQVVVSLLVLLLLLIKLSVLLIVLVS